jgi:hypothetical protein
MIPAMLRSSYVYNGEGTDFTWLSLDYMIWLEVSVNFSLQRIPNFHVLECSRMQHFRIRSRTN